MKTLLCLFCMIVINGAAAAQDVIILNDSVEIKAVVLDTSRGKVAYKEWNDMTGTVFTKPAAEVQSIIYQNGKTKKFGSGRTNTVGYKPNGRLYMKYQWDIALGYAYFLNRESSSDFNANLQVETVHGIRINPYIFTGLGMGYTAHEYSVLNGSGILTLYANVGFYYFLQEKYSLFLSTDIGYAENTNTGVPNNRFYFACGPGISMGRLIPCSFSIRYQYLGKQMNAVQFRIGIGF